MTSLRFSLSLLPGLLLVLPSGAVDFVHEVAPILKENCAKCHMGDKHKGGFSMNTREDFLKENDGHFAMEVGNSGKSLLIKMLRSTLPPEIIVPPPTMESTAMPTRPPPTSEKTNLAGPKGPVLPRMGHSAL